MRAPAVALAERPLRRYAGVMSPAAAPSGTDAGRSYRILAILAAMALLGLTASFVAALRSFNGREARAEQVLHTYRVDLGIADVRQRMEQAENARRGYFLTGSPLATRSWREAVGGMSPALARLGALTADNPRQQAIIAQVRPRVATLLRQHAVTNRLVAAGDPEGALAAFRTQENPRLFRSSRGLLNAMSAEENRLLLGRETAQARALSVFRWTAGLAALLVSALAVAALVVIGRYVGALSHSEDELRRLNTGLEERVVERTADLTRANDEIQRFAYIVSHDLRSPLVNVMGFTAELDTATTALRALVDRAETEAPALLTDEARFAAREDLPEAIGFIRTSTQKMDRLINAILQLSRQGRRLLSPEPLDLAAMTDTIRATLAHRLADADAELMVKAPLPALVSDRFSVDQILSNLIENAAKYLRPDVPGRIVVRGRQEGSRAIVEVADNGRGIDPRDHARVFDLFRRSGAQDRPGEGIGLATVRALAFRLGGTIEVASALGEGATFRLSLPLTLEQRDTTE